MLQECPRAVPSRDEAALHSPNSPASLGSGSHVAFLRFTLEPQRDRRQSLVAGSGGGSAILCLWQLARPASPRWLRRGFAGEQRRNKIPFPSPTPRDAAAIFNLPPHPVTGKKKKKRSWRVRGTYPTGGLPRTRGVVLQALRRPGSLLTSGSRLPGGVGPEA